MNQRTHKYVLVKITPMQWLKPTQIIKIYPVIQQVFKMTKNLLIWFKIDKDDSKGLQWLPKSRGLRITWMTQRISKFIKITQMAKQN